MTRRATYIGGPWDGLHADAPTDVAGNLTDEVVVVLPAAVAPILADDDLTTAPVIGPTYRYRLAGYTVGATYVYITRDA